MGKNSDRPAQTFLTRAKTQSPELAHHAITGIDRNDRNPRLAGTIREIGKAGEAQAVAACAARALGWLPSHSAMAKL